MASLIDIENLTMNEAEAQGLARLIIEREFVNGVLADNHDIHTGILYKEQIPFAGRLGDALKKSEGCTPNDGGSIPFSEKQWDPEIYDARFTHCAADVNKLFKLFQKVQRINPDYFDKSGSQEMQMIYSLVAQMMRETLPVKVWFSDRAADTVANGGVFANGTDIELYNVIDGLFKQIMADVSEGDPNYVAIDANEGESYAAQSLSPEDAFNILADMRAVADERLIADPDAKFYVTRSIADAYRSHLRTKNLGSGYLEFTEGGRPQLQFDGVQIETMFSWDRTIKSVQDNGTAWHLPHRAVLTTPENIPVGTLSTEDLEDFVSFYDPLSRSNIIDVAFSLDAKHIASYLTVAAY